MDSSNEEIDLKSRVALYRNFDAARQQELEEIADIYDRLKEKTQLLEADLADEKETRQNWRKRAQDAETALRRSQFILVLIDGDGYIFKDSYLRDAGESGGARAAHELCTEVHDYLRERNIIDPSGPDMEVMVNVYANRAGLAKYLHDTDMIQHPAQLDQFFQSFAQNKAMSQFIDCGHGKERADAKLRETYRFFVNNPTCKHIFLACCHDNGYVAELDKYRHDPMAVSKTILVHSMQMGRGYNSLNFPIAYLNVFNTQPLSTVKKEIILPSMPVIPRMPSLPAADETSSQTSADAPSTNAPSTWSSITASGAPTPAKKTVNLAAGTSSVSASKVSSPQPEIIEPNIVHTKGIPVNRQGQRVDLKMIIPTSQDLEAFEDRIAGRKLCNKHHLTNNCASGDYCRYDHGPIDTKMKNTLRYKARSIPCQSGPHCRDADCFYGHQCPWGRDKCTNPKCAFVQRGMHNISDLEVAKYAPIEEY